MVCNEVKAKINIRLFTQAQLLRSGAAFFAASKSVTRNDWKVFIESNKLNKNLPGITGIGFSVIIKKEQLQQHIQQIRKEGFPEYQVYPLGDREIYTSIIYLEPFAGKNLRAFGYDMFSESTRRKAMEQACDSDLAVLSGKVLLMQESEKEVQAGNLMYVSIFRNGLPTITKEERRSAVLGWVYTPNRMNDLMHEVLGIWDLNDDNKIHLQIYDNDEISLNSLLYDSQSNDTIAHTDNIAEAIKIPFVFNGKLWTLVFTKPNQQFLILYSKVLLVFFTGFVISLLLFWLSLSIFNTRFRAEQIAEKLSSKLKESELKFSLFMDFLPVSVFIKDQDGRNMFFNRHLIHLMGFQNWENKSNGDLFNDNEASRISEDDKKAMELGTFKFEEIIMDGKGIHRTFETRKFLIPRQGQEPLLGGISLDITESKTHQKILEQHEIKLSELNATKDKFFTIIAHDLKSPFHSIIGLSNYLLDQIDNKDIEGIHKYANLILNSSNKAMDLVVNLLEWSRSQTGLITYKPEHFDLVSLIDSTTLLFNGIALQKSITIKSILPPAISITADKDMVGAVLRNLISNAIKFTKLGGEIKISVLEKQNEIFFSISDNGVGISENSIEKLFRIDQSYSTTGTNHETGTGLGLIICKDFIEKNHGKIWVESEQGKGSTFYFTLPYSNELIVKNRSANSIVSTTKSLDTSTLSKLKILIAEDDETSEKLLCLQLKAFCKEFFIVKNGVEAVRICRENPDINLIMMDINMPEMNGYIATQEIRKFNTNVVIIAQTADTLTGAREKSIASGCNEYMVKPINKNELLAFIQKHFES